MPDDENDAKAAKTKQEPAQEDTLSEVEFAKRAQQRNTALHTLRGALAQYQQELILVVEGGGYWVLDGPSKLHHYVGHCITIEGTRTSFNGIDVKRFTPED
jgi:hypothetical protein